MVKMCLKTISVFFYFTRNTIFTYDYEGDPVHCYYKVKAPLVTSTSDNNPGRRFFGYNNYKVHIYQKL